jgi:hypothetical protein
MHVSPYDTTGLAFRTHADATMQGVTDLPRPLSICVERRDSVGASGLAG